MTTHANARPRPVVKPPVRMNDALLAIEAEKQAAELATIELYRKAVAATADDEQPPEKELRRLGCSACKRSV